MIEARTFKDIRGIRHGFFTRHGGASSGLYSSLNTGLGSDDDKSLVHQNRDHVRTRLGADLLMTPYQEHGDGVALADEPWPWQEPRRRGQPRM